MELEELAVAIAWVVGVFAACLALLLLAAPPELARPRAPISQGCALPAEAR